MKKFISVLLLATSAVMCNSCSSGSTGNSVSPQDPPVGATGYLKFNKSNIILKVGTTANVTLSLMESTLSPELDFPLFIAEPAIITIASPVCMLDGGNPPSCSISITASQVGSTILNAGGKDGNLRADLTVTVTNN